MAIGEDVADLQALTATLRTELDRERQDRQQLRREYDGLANKLRYPGTKFLVDLEYKLVYDTTLTIATSTLALGAVFETLPGALHAVYALSAYAPSSNTPVLITDGSVIVAPSNAVTVAIQRQRQTSPTRIEAKVAVYNATAGDVDIAIRVWRRLGMGS